MTMAAGLHVVLSGRLGFAISDDLDCSVFAVETASGSVLFDAGAGRRPEAMRAALAALPAQPSHVFLTHAHADHSGGAWVLRELGLIVVAGQATAAIVEAADEEAMSLARARRLGLYPPDFSVRPCPVDYIMSPSETLLAGGAAVMMIPTPGHSADHVSYLVRTPDRICLVGGDALFEGGKIVLQDIWDCDLAASCQSIRTLGQHSFDTFLPGHGPVRLTDAMEPARAALRRLDRLLAPELFL